MDKRQFIRETLKGFDFTAKQRTTFLEKFLRRVERAGLEKEEDIYKYVTTVLDWQSTSPQFRYAVANNSLDSNRFDRGSSNDDHGFPKSRNTLQNTLGITDTGLERLIEAPKEEETLSMPEALGIVTDSLGKEDVELLRDLQSRVDGTIWLPLDRGKILDSLEIIKDRIRWVRDVFYDDEEGLVIPENVEIDRLNPLELRVGRQDSETVRKVYEAHKKGMSRKSAAEYSGVSDAIVKRLWDFRGLVSKHNKLNGKSRKVDGRTKAKIFEAHDLRMTYMQAGEYAGVSHNTIRNYWKREGLEPHHGRRDGKRGRSSASSKKVEAMIRCYHEGKGSYVTAREVGEVTPTTVVRHWKLAGLKPRGGKSKITGEEAEGIVGAYKEGLTPKEAAREIGISVETVRKHYGQIVELNDGEIGILVPETQENRRSKLKPEQIEEIVAAHEEHDGHLGEATKNLPYSHITIRKYWGQHGLKPERKSDKANYTGTDINQMVSAYETFRGRLDLASRNLPFPKEAIRRYWLKEGLRPLHHNEKFFDSF